MRAPDFWQKPPGLASGLLAPLGRAWNAAAQLRGAIARPDRMPVPVICVGNLVAGGAGKTPVALSLARLIGARGIAVHIVSRGYGGSLAGPLQIDPERHDAAAVGDEALLSARIAPAWIGRDRAAAARSAVAAGAQALILDDGLQNPGIVKDLSLVVVDAEYGFGNGRVIPAGPLREGIGAGLARADAIVLIGEGRTPPELQQAASPVLRALLKPLHGERFAGERVVAFAGIARPEKFFAALRAIGATAVIERPFPDHHRFADREIAGLRCAAERAGARLVTTAKDWVRLPERLRQEIQVLEVEIGWDDPDAVARLLSDVLPEACREPGDGPDGRAATG